MIALDTNALVRLLIEDDANQAKAVQSAVSFIEKTSQQIIILPEVLIKTVWVLESVYKCTRKEIVQFLNTLLSVSVFSLVDSPVIRYAFQQYKKGGDFVDFIIIGQARKNKARKLFSFDRKLQKMFPEYVIDNM